MHSNKLTRRFLLLFLPLALSGCGFIARHTVDGRAIPEDKWSVEYKIQNDNKLAIAIDFNSVYCCHRDGRVIAYLRFWEGGKMIWKSGEFDNPITTKVADSLNGSFVGVYNVENGLLVTECFRPRSGGYIFQVMAFTVFEDRVEAVDKYTKRSRVLWWESSEIKIAASSAPLIFVRQPVFQMKSNPDW